MIATIPGTPVGASRPRVVRAGGGVRAYLPDTHVRWEEQARQILAAAWRGAPPHDGPVCVVVEAYHHRPARLRRKRDPREAIRACCKPDLDNVAKLALDALVKAGVLVDDTRVAELRAARWYVPIDAQGVPTWPESVVIRVWPLVAP